MSSHVAVKLPDRLTKGFRSYVESRRLSTREHMDGNGLPDYAFSLDYELRKRLDSIPHFYSLSKKICATYASRTLQIINQHGLSVGPNQFSEVYAIGRDCAKRLGIGIPNIYIINEQSLNAYTIATDDVEPLIVIHSGLYERFTPGELRAVIGHECGHIHNQHSVYDIMGRIVLGGGVGAISRFGISQSLWSIISMGSNVALSAWSRAEEVTCDRAGMICCESIDDVYSAEAKFLYGAAFGEHHVDFEELEKQLDQQRNSLVRIEELDDSHPATVRRIMAEKAFAECELLYRWRPDLRVPGQKMRSKEETDALCVQYIQVIRK